MSQNPSHTALSHEMRLTSIRYLGPQINLYEISPMESSLVQEFSAGSHVDVHLPNGIIRQYSLVNSGEDHRYLIGVKLDRQSRGGSRYMHETLRVGSVLKVSAPRNNFPLAEDARHSVLIAGGIGITPIAAMAKRLEQIGASWELHYAVRARDEACFLDELNVAKVNIHVDAEHHGTPMNLAEILAKAPPDAHVYCCGPGPMLDIFESCAQGRPAENIHIERFSAAPVAADPSSQGYTIKLNKSGYEFGVEPGQTLLAALRQHNIDVATSCEQGICGTCETKVLEGVPDHHDSLLSHAEKASNKVMMVCCSGSKSDLLVLDL